MPEMLEYIHEKFHRLAGKIIGMLTGLEGYEVEAVKARVPDIRRAAGVRLARRFPPLGNYRDIR